MSIEQLKQQVRGEIPKTGNLVQQAISGFGKALPSLAGPIGEGIAQPEAVPERLQGAGSILGFLGGARFGRPNIGQIIGGTAGRTIGETGRQAIRGIQGKGFDIREIGRQASTAAATEAVGGGIAKFGSKVFSGTAGKFFRNITGSRLGKALEKVEGTVPLQQIRGKVESVLTDLTDEIAISPSQNRLLKSSVSDIFKTIEEKGRNFTVTDLTRSKRRIDQVLTSIKAFSKEGKKRGRVIDIDVASVAGKIRRIFDEELGQLAAQTGKGVFKELKSAKSAFARTAREFPPGQVGAGGLVPDILRASAVARGMTGDFSGALGTLLGSEAVEAKITPLALFGALQAGTKLAPSFITEQLRRKKR